jgi:hypothetical protein
MKLIGLKILLALGVFALVVGSNIKASASGSCAKYTMTARSMSSRTLVGYGFRPVNFSTENKFDFKSSSTNMSLYIDDLYNKAFHNFAFAVQPNISGNSHNRATFLFLSRLKI